MSSTRASFPNRGMSSSRSDAGSTLKVVMVASVIMASSFAVAAGRKF